jgi:hypothetical protein
VCRACHGALRASLFAQKIDMHHIQTVMNKLRATSWVPAPVSLTFRNLYYKKDGVLRLQGVSGASSSPPFRAIGLADRVRSC